MSMIVVSNGISGIFVSEGFSDCNPSESRGFVLSICVRSTYSFCKDGIFIEVASWGLLEIRKELKPFHLSLQSPTYLFLILPHQIHNIPFILSNKNIFTHHI